MVSGTPRPHFTPGIEPVPIVQEAGWALGPVWTGGKSRPHRDSIPDRPARSQSLYRLSYQAHCSLKKKRQIKKRRKIEGVSAGSQKYGQINHEQATRLISIEKKKNSERQRLLSRPIRRREDNFK